MSFATTSGPVALPPVGLIELLHLLFIRTWLRSVQV